jgi:hypothetical protein
MSSSKQQLKAALHYRIYMGYIYLLASPEFFPRAEGSFEKGEPEILPINLRLNYLSLFK